MNAAHEINSIASEMEFVHGVKPKARAHIVRKTNKPTGRRLFAAKRSTKNPQKKYPTPHARGGIHTSPFRSSCDTCIARFRYNGTSVRMGPGATHVSA